MHLSRFSLHPGTEVRICDRRLQTVFVNELREDTQGTLKCPFFREADLWDSSPSLVPQTLTAQ
jgi:hypothetical protein